MSKVIWKRGHHSNGERHYEIPYINSQRHGVARWYFKDGQLEGEIAYVNGKARNDLLKEKNRLIRLMLLGR